MKKYMIGASVALALFVFILGWSDARTYMSGARAYTKDAIKERIPTELEISRLRAMLTELDGAIEKRRSALVDLELEGEALEREIGRRRDRLTQDEALLGTYFGTYDRDLTREFRVMKAMAALRESLWAVVQGSKSTIAFDYDAYRDENFEKFCRVLAAVP